MSTFKIVPIKLLDDSFNAININGNIPLFEGNIYINVSFINQISESVPGEAITPAPAMGSASHQKSFVLLRDDLVSISEDAIKVAVADKLGITFA